MKLFSEQKILYREVLSNLGLTPEILIEEYKNGKKTILVDYCSTGAGLVSFLFSWAQEQYLVEPLKEAIDLLILDSNKYRGSYNYIKTLNFDGITLN